MIGFVLIYENVGYNVVLKYLSIKDRGIRFMGLV